MKRTLLQNLKKASTPKRLASLVALATVAVSVLAPAGAHALTLGQAQYSAGGTWFALCKEAQMSATGPEWKVTVLLDRGIDPNTAVGTPTQTGNWGLAYYGMYYGTHPINGTGWWQKSSQKALGTWMHGGYNNHDWMGMTTNISAVSQEGVQVVVGSDAAPNRPTADPWAVPPAVGPSQSPVFEPSNSTVMPNCY